jgi:Cu/Zn superoxide dismutase
MSSTDPTDRGPDDDLPRRPRGKTPLRARMRLSVVAPASTALAAAAALILAVPACASSSSASGGGSAAAGVSPAAHVLVLQAMPVGTVTFDAASRGHLTVHADMFGLTPGSAHNVDLLIPGRSGIQFSSLTADDVGRANQTLESNLTGQMPRGSRLLVRMGAQGGGVATEPVASTGQLSGSARGPYQLVPVEVSSGGASFGTPRGRATVSYNRSRDTLTVTIDASGFTPGSHAAHIHLGSCARQGPVKYMLKDLTADSHGNIVHAVQAFTHVTTPIPASGWYLNIHQGNSNNILSNGQPTILFRPLLCADV